MNLFGSFVGTFSFKKRLLLKFLNEQKFSLVNGYLFEKNGMNKGIGLHFEQKNAKLI